MKAECMWKLGVQIGLLMMTALAAFSVCFTFLFIVPSLIATHVELGKELPSDLRATINIANSMSWLSLPGLVALVGGLGLFEWKCRSENKTHIRNVIGVGVSLLLVSVALWVSGVTIFSLLSALNALA